jgi:hypothetical protein
MKIHYIATHRGLDKPVCGDTKSNKHSNELHNITCKKCIDKVKKSILSKKSNFGLYQIV